MAVVETLQINIAGEPCPTAPPCQLRHCDTWGVSLSFGCLQAYETSTNHNYRSPAIDGVWEASARIRGYPSAADPGTETPTSPRSQD